MSNEKETFTKVFEEALNKSMETNKAFLNESSKFIRQLGNKDAMNRFSIFKGDTISTTLTRYMKLNLDHFNNLVDLSLNFIRKVNDNSSNETEPVTPVEPPATPSFLLQQETEAGKNVDFQFLLDNVREETVTCQLVHTGFTGESGHAASFKTDFTPPVFDLKAGEARSIRIAVSVPADATIGVYSTRVLVKGYEPAYFSIQITVIAPQTQTTPDGGFKEKSKRK